MHEETQELSKQQLKSKKRKPNLRAANRFKKQGYETPVN